MKNANLVQRSSNFELLRICCMLMIIGGHIIMVHQAPFNLQNMDFPLELFLRGAFAVAVNTFVLISGYFGIRYKWQRLFSLDMQAVFYSLTLLLIAILLGWHTIDIKRDFLLFFPILSKQYWFITCYAVLYLISPLLNQWSNSLEKKNYRRLLLVGFIILYLWPTIGFLLNAPLFIEDAGYGIINFIYLYMLGQYIRYKYVDDQKVYKYCIGYTLSVFTLFLSQYGVSYLLGFEFSAWISYNTIFIFAGALFLFLVFKNVKISSAWINALAKPCLAVYFIHLHPFIWKPFCEMIGVSSFHGWRYLVLVLMLPIVIYLFCAAIEYLRILMFGKIEESFVTFIESKR